MGKKSRVRKKTIYIGMEGYREVYFLEHIKKIYFSREVLCNTNIEWDEIKGSTPVKMLLTLFQKSSIKQRSYLIIDNDTVLNSGSSRNDLDDLKNMIKKCWQLDSGQDISDDIKISELALLNTKNRMPLIIVSEPINMDGLIIRVFGKELPKLSVSQNTDTDKIKLKSKCDSILGINKTEDKLLKRRLTLEFYNKHLTKQMLDSQAQRYPCLQQMINIFM